MNKSKIDWCDSTWNPITGCKHTCEYCYARAMTKRFSTITAHSTNEIHELKIRGKTLYPFGFDPTFHRYRLDELQKLKKPSTIFVGSMCDMFGEWVPDEWIEEVFKACEAAPQHRYLFLTKNPKRYGDFKFCYENVIESNYLFGATVTNQKQLRELITCRPLEEVLVSFLSIEPIFDCILIPPIFLKHSYLKWIIVGAETGNRKDKVIPEREWIENIVNACRESNTPVFLKNNLSEIWGEPLIQEYPFERRV